MQKLAQLNHLPPLVISNGSMEAIKWLALISMTLDHANRFLFQGEVYSFYCIGRIAMPLFAMIFAYNLSRPDAFSRGLYPEVIKRLLIFGLLATPAYMAMRHLPQCWPLNILFSLAIATTILYLYQKGGIESYLLALILLFFGGSFVEYNWAGLFLCLFAWWYFKTNTFVALLAFLASYWFLDNLNGNAWALLSLPLIIAASLVDLRIKRIRHFFYFYYPIHLSLLYLLRSLNIVYN